MALVSLLLLLFCTFAWPPPNGLALTPPMGWMSWAAFRCATNKNDRNNSISQWMLSSMADAMADRGFLKAGYKTISIDDCWQNRARAADGSLEPNPDRFPDGMKSLADHMHAKGVHLGIYSATGPHSCQGLPASEGHEVQDANTFAKWGVDYLKLDRCSTPHNNTVFKERYTMMGKALNATGRPIVYSCSWPVGMNETAKPWADIIGAGCNLWRNFRDIQESWSSITSTMDHWGDYGRVLQSVAGPGHWHDMDQILIGDHRRGFNMTYDQARSQMSIWSICASPLILSDDLRTIHQDYIDIVTNPEVIAVSQDPLGRMGLRISPKGPLEVWARNLSDGGLAVALFNKDNSTAPPTPPTPPPSCQNCTWNITKDQYLDGGRSGNIKCEKFKTLHDAQAKCCAITDCHSFSFQEEEVNGVHSGCLKKYTATKLINKKGFAGYQKICVKGGEPPVPDGAATITIDFADVGLKKGSYQVRDLWERKDLCVFKDSFKATVPLYGTTFVKLTSTLA